MLETIISTVDGSSFTLSNALIVIGVSILLGLIISISYVKTNKNSGSVPTFATTLIMLPVIIAIIILLVGNNVARAFSLAGAFSIIRFRSAPGDPKDIAYIFFTLAVGLACGMGYIGYGVIFTIILCALMIIISITNYGVPKTKPMQLKIVVPEDLNYEETFDEIIKNYTTEYKIERVKTRDFGALFELIYLINMKQDTNHKNFIDELRARNGNLNISLNYSYVSDKSY